MRVKDTLLFMMRLGFIVVLTAIANHVTALNNLFWKYVKCFQ